MMCQKCRARLVRQEHLPTDELGTYEWECGSIRDDNGFSQSSKCKASEITEGSTVKRRLKNGKLSERTGVVKVVYDGQAEVVALVQWTSSHKRLAYAATRSSTERIADLERVSS